MTISTQARTAGPFSTNGSTTVFPFTFKVFAASDVAVVFRDNATGAEATLSLGVDYSVSLNSNQDANPGGSISTIGPAYPSGATLTLTSKLQYLQPTDLTNQGGFYPKVITNALDRLTIFSQQILGLANRALKFPISDGNLDATLPGKDQRKGKVLAFHETTGLPVVGPTIADTDTVAGIAADIAAVAAIAADVSIAADNVADITNFSDVYLGPRSADPATRTDSSPLQEGDLYFNTANKALRAYTGTQWQEAITGSVAVQQFTGDGSTVDFQLNSAPDSENVVQVFVDGVYQSKTAYDITGLNSDILTFNTAPSNGAKIEAVTFSVLPLGVVDAVQVRMPEGGTLADLKAPYILGKFVTPEMCGAVGDGVANDAAAIKQWLESPLKKVAKYGATYNLGTIAGDVSLASTTGIDHDIDFNFCKIVCAGDISAVYTATAMLRVTNGRLAVRNLAGFNDTNFASRGAGRGVAPWLVVNDGVNTEGYSLENIVLDNCQSFGTFFSADSTYQARGIQIGAGCVVKGNCERGITLSDSGSNIRGSFKLLGTVNRNIFAQNISGVDLLIYGGTCAASNGNVLITCSDGKTMSNIKLRIRNEQIYSVSVIAKGAGSTFKNIDIDVWSDVIGDVNTEVIRFGAQDVSGNWLPSVNFTARDIRFRIRSNTKQFVEFAMQTYSTNVDYVSLDVFGNYTFSNQGSKTYFDMKGRYYKSEILSSTAVPMNIDTSRFVKNVANIGLEIYVKGSGSGGVEIASKYYVKAFKASDGTLSSFSATALYSIPTSGGAVALSASGQNIVATFSGFAGVLYGTVAVSEFEF